MVLDQGGRYQPALQNFDHHQLGSDHPDCCTLTLTLEALGYDISMVRRVMPWLPFTETMDSQGPTRAAMRFGLRPEQMPHLQSPVEKTILRMFGDSQQVEGALLELMHKLGSTLLGELEEISALLKVLEPAKTKMLNDIMVFDATECTLTTSPVLTSAIEQHLRTNQWSKQCAVIVIKDGRGDGLALLRRNDHPRIDFRRLRAVLR